MHCFQPSRTPLQSVFPSSIACCRGADAGRDRAADCRCTPSANACRSRHRTSGAKAPSTRRLPASPARPSNRREPAPTRARRRSRRAARSRATGGSSRSSRLVTDRPAASESVRRITRCPLARTSRSQVPAGQPRREKPRSTPLASTASGTPDGAMSVTSDSTGDRPPASRTVPETTSPPPRLGKLEVEVALDPHRGRHRHGDRGNPCMKGGGPDLPGSTGHGPGSQDPSMALVARSRARPPGRARVTWAPANPPRAVDTRPRTIDSAPRATSSVAPPPATFHREFLDGEPRPDDAHGVRSQRNAGEHRHPEGIGVQRGHRRRFLRVERRDHLDFRIRHCRTTRPGGHTDRQSVHGCDEIDTRQRLAGGEAQTRLGFEDQAGSGRQEIAGPRFPDEKA